MRNHKHGLCVRGKGAIPPYLGKATGAQRHERSGTALQAFSRCDFNVSGTDYCPQKMATLGRIDI